MHFFLTKEINYQLFMFRDKHGNERKVRKRNCYRQSEEIGVHDDSISKATQGSKERLTAKCVAYCTLHLYIHDVSGATYYRQHGDGCALKVRSLAFCFFYHYTRHATTFKRLEESKRRVQVTSC